MAQCNESIFLDQFDQIEFKIDGVLRNLVSFVMEIGE